MKTLKNFWVSIKRNPVVLAFLTAVAMQVFQDYMANSIDWAHFFGYISMVCLSVIARGFTVPAKEHSETVDKLNRELYDKAVNRD